MKFFNYTVNNVTYCVCAIAYELLQLYVLCVYMYVCVCVYMYVCTCVHLCVCTCMHVCVCTCMCMYMYVCMCTCVSLTSRCMIISLVKASASCPKGSPSTCWSSCVLGARGQFTPTRMTPVDCYKNHAPHASTTTIHQVPPHITTTTHH